ncbi:MAG: carboxypeptidase regulatory-like domain-containing protein, partial [bacterium]
MIIFRQFLIFTLFFLEFSFSTDIPVNSVQKGGVTDWLFLGPIKEGSDSFSLVGKIEKDPFNYFLSDKLEGDLRIARVESKIIYGGQFYYQLYSELNKGDVIYAFSQIESRKDQKVIFDNNSAEGHFEIFLNGNFIKKIDNRKQYTEVDLKKGLNDLVLKIYPNDYDLSLTNLYHRFFFNIIPEDRFTINGYVKDKNGESIAFAKVTAYDNSLFHEADADENGFFEFNFFPVSDTYQLSVSHNNINAYSELIFSKSRKISSVNLVCDISSEFFGSAYMLDGDTPNAGISIVLEKINSNDNYKKWKAVTDENGKFKTYPNKGQYHIAYFADDEKKYFLKNDGQREVLKFNGQNKIERDLTISNQVKGSWKKIDLFDGMLSNGVYDLLIGTDG